MDLHDEILMLERTPRVLSSWLSGLPEDWLDAREGEDTFSPRDVLGHLIHGESINWMPRLRLMCEFGDTREFEPFDRVGLEDAIRGRTIDQLLEEFAELRQANLAELRSFNLRREDLATRGRHPSLGEVNIGQLLAAWATHDLNHLGQIARVMAKQQAQAVGPWKAYLGILSWKS